MHIFDNIKDVNVPILEKDEYYIYVLENSPQHNIKIGISSNMQQRLTSLSGSNTGGNEIIRCAISDMTYLYTLERILHIQFKEYRIPSTEWFNGITFEQACNAVDNLFNAKDYILCNNIRKNYNAQLKHLA